MNIKPNLLEDNNSIIPKSRFKPEKTLVAYKSKKLELDSISVFTSKKLDRYEFTNFLNANTKNDCYFVLDKLISDLEKSSFENLDFDLDEGLDDMHPEQVKKVCNILGLYTNNEVTSLSDINKAKVKGFANHRIGFRIYFKLTTEAYKVILLDPLHFAVPAKNFQNKKEYSFSQHKNNNVCMTKIISEDFVLDKKYNKLKRNLVMGSKEAI